MGIKRYKSVDIDGIIYKINYTVETMLNIAELSEKETETDEEKNNNAFEQLKLFYEVIPPNVEEAYKKLFDFFCYSTTDKKEGSNKKVMSFTHDESKIMSSFWQQYKIKDDEFYHLHWFTFLELLEGLTSDTRFARAIQNRTAKINKNMSKEEKAHIKKMKKLDALPDNRSEEEKERDFANALHML